MDNMVEDNRDREVDDTEEYSEDESDSADGMGLRDYFSKLLMIIGLCLIGLFIAFWVESVIYEQHMGGLKFKEEQGLNFIWRVLASAVSERYLYAIVGIILCLLAIHLIGRKGWYKAVPFLVSFAGLIAVVLVVGFLGLVFVLDWGEFWSPHHSSAFLYLVRFFTELTALIAIIVVEIPYLQQVMRHKHPREEPGTELIDE